MYTAHSIRKNQQEFESIVQNMQEATIRIFLLY